MRDRELHCFFSSHAWAVSSGEGSRLWSQTAWAHLPTLVLTSFVIWGKPFTFDRTLLSRLKVELIIVTTSQVLQKLCKATMQSAWHKAWVIINVCKCQLLLLDPYLNPSELCLFPFPKCVFHCCLLEIGTKIIDNRKGLMSDLEDLKTLVSISYFLIYTIWELDKVISEVPVISC